ncbi:DUF6318 family protein [Kocuria subflava]|uniref:DUF6318 domain-containing protein n=1 Tax=Kocuria subflava TaxID=1736139 RepID=A0A846TQL6_9MICC|nr:hypothetical protein [Kocuria subflava]
MSAVLLVGGVLTGCGDTSTNDDGDASPGSASPTESASASGGADGYVEASAEGPAQDVPKPSKPAVADEESVEGAQAFLDYLSDARVYAWQTGDTSILRDITAPACDFCLEEYDAIDEHYADGGWATSGREELTILDDPMPVDDYGFPAPRVKSKFEGITIWDSTGAVVEELEPIDSPDHVALMHLNHMDGEWELVMPTPVQG